MIPSANRDWSSDGLASRASSNAFSPSINAPSCRNFSTGCGATAKSSTSTGLTKGGAIAKPPSRTASGCIVPSDQTRDRGSSLTDRISHYCFGLCLTRRDQLIVADLLSRPIAFLDDSFIILRSYDECFTDLCVSLTRASDSLTRATDLFFGESLKSLLFLGDFRLGPCIGLSNCLFSVGIGFGCFTSGIGLSHTGGRTRRCQPLSLPQRLLQRHRESTSGVLPRSLLGGPCPQPPPRPKSEYGTLGTDTACRPAVNSP